MVYLIIVTMLAISGTIIYVCSATRASLKLRYPQTDCKTKTAQYTGENPIFSMDDWKIQSFKEFHINEALKKKGKST